MRHYGDKKYWEQHYKNIEEATFDWLEEYPDLKEIIYSLKILKESGKILNVGCGNSELFHSVLWKKIHMGSCVADVGKRADGYYQHDG